MAMKPRTFRRIVLLGSLGIIMLVVVLGYFVVRPWQNQRQLEAMRTDGLEAYEQGDYVDATRFLGRYTNNAEEIDPELLLKLARARYKVQVPYGGHVAVAINVYREYLLQVPDDVDASKELLPLMNDRGMFVEARSLAEDLLDDPSDNDIQVLRELRYALRGLQSSPSVLEPVYRDAFEHPESSYRDARAFFDFLAQNGREDEIEPLIQSRSEQFPDRVDEQFMKFRYLLVVNMNDTELNYELASIIGLDPNTGQWASGAPLLSSGAAEAVSEVFNLLRETRSSIAVLTRSAVNHEDDYFSRVWAPRLLYWANEHEQLAELELTTENGEPDPDLIGYQYLSAIRGQDDELATQAKTKLESVVLDVRAQAWKQFITGEAALRNGDSVAARVSVQKALDIYQTEPTFNLVMGDIQIAQGRFNEAVELWETSSELANGPMGADFLIRNSGWTTPMIRIVNAYSSQRRLLEATQYIQELERIGHPNSPAPLIVLRSKAELARRGQLPIEMGNAFVDQWNERKDDLDSDARAIVSPLVATILATMQQTEQAKQELRLGLVYAAQNPSLLVDIVDVDARYGLGVASEAGIDTQRVGADTIEGALRIATRVSQEQQSTDAGLRIFDESMAQAPQEQLESWRRARVQFLDARADNRANEAWEQLLEANPQDIELHFAAAESNAFSTNLARVDSLIAKITELTSTAGKTTSSRLRLARANAIVGTAANRTNRDRALEIVRSVVATEPSNTNARNMLGRLLSLAPKPGLPENERYTPDIQGAIDQYMTLARQMNHRASQIYMLEASDLAFRMGDQDQASSILREYVVRFTDDWIALPLAAERYENLGQLQQAADIYQRVLNNNGNTDSAIAYADLQLKLGNTTIGMRMLQQISEQETLTQAQVLQLASLFARSGKQPEAEAIARDAQRFGLEPAEAKMVLAQFARGYLSEDAQLKALREATEIDPSYELAWRQLIQRLIELGRLEQARAAYEQAIAVIPTNDTIERLGMLSLGEPESADALLQMPGIKDNPMMREAITQVGVYENLRENAETQQRVQLLTSLIDGYPSIEAIQSYAVAELSRLEIDPRLISSVAERALKNATGNIRIMGIAGESALLSNQPEKAISIVELWRANSLESSLIAEVITGRALLQLEEYQQAADLLAGYVDAAYQAPFVPENREVLDVYSFARLKIGEDPSVTAARLEPLISTNDAIRNVVWLGLASSVIEDASVGADWIRKAAEHADLDSDDDRLALARAWVQLAQRHQLWDRTYAERAIELLMPLVERESPNAMPLRAMATAHVILARSNQDQGLGSDDYATAIGYLLQAADLDPGNISPLLEAAQYSLESEMHDQAIAIYDRLLSYPIPDGEFKASLYNNLAMARLRVGAAESDQSELIRLVEQATGMSPNTATFWGTRGWVELEFGQWSAAEQSFRSLLRLEPESAEGSTGLAIVLHQTAPADSVELQATMDKVRSLGAQQAISSELIEYLKRYGLQDLATSVSP